MILPLVLLTLVVLLALSAAAQQLAWRASRGAQSVWNSQRAFYDAESVVEQAIVQWPGDTMATMAIGSRMITMDVRADGWIATQSLVRTAPLVAEVSATVSRGTAGTGTSVNADQVTRTRRSVSRTVLLAPPTFGLDAAFATSGALRVASSVLDGRDIRGVLGVGGDDCGPWRDSASVSAVSAAALSITGAPVVAGATDIVTGASLATQRAQFDSAWSLLLARAPSPVVVSGGALGPSPPWHARLIRGAPAVTITAPSAAIGLLAVDGDLVVRGALRVDGLLLVRGALDVSSGTLEVHGAVRVRDTNGTGSSIGDASRIEWAPCLAARALVPVSVPRVMPFATWGSP